MTMTEWQRREEDERQALSGLGAAIAAELGDWTSERKPDDWGATLTKTGGVPNDEAQLFLSFDRGAPEAKRRERVVIHATYPRRAADRYRYADESDYQRRAVKRWEITVAASRGAEVIAREIRRRLLPGYLADLRAVQGWTVEHEAYLDRCQALAEELGALLHVEPTVYDRGTYGTERSYELRWSPTGDGYATFRVSPDSVYVERGSIPAEKMRKIAAILAE